MNFRKYEIDNLKLKAAEGNVVIFLDEICLAFRQHAKMKQINFEFKHDEDNINLYYDRDKFEILVVNLLSNAFKFTPQHGAINLKLKQTSIEKARKLIELEDEFPSASYGEFSEGTRKLVQVEVSDTGVGIKKEQLQHVFERYFQASNIQTISVGGTGIGLEITKNYTELHHGCIMVKSKEGVGTTFYVWLPMGRLHLSEMDIIQDFKPSEHKDHYKDPSKKIKKKFADILSVQEKKEIKKQQPTILIVDDNPDIIFFLRENFEKSFNVLTAQNGKVALETAIEQMPDVIISDIMMPEMDGLEFCKRIKSEVTTSHIPVILLTARTSDVFQAEGLETGADDYITKPFDEKILNIRVKNLIESRKRLRERYSKEVTLMPRDITITRPDENFLDKVIEIIEDNLSDSNLKVEMIAREIGMSHSVLYKKILALTDLTIVEFVRTIRLKKASILLSKTNSSITQVSHEVGFIDPKYFSKCFQSLFGVTPSSYKMENA
jgi:DNA-binding response OmpR family regulator